MFAKLVLLGCVPAISVASNPYLKNQAVTPDEELSSNDIPEKIKYVSMAIAYGANLGISAATDDSYGILALGFLFDIFNFVNLEHKELFLI